MPSWRVNGVWLRRLILTFCGTCGDLMIVLPVSSAYSSRIWLRSASWKFIIFAGMSFVLPRGAMFVAAKLAEVEVIDGPAGPEEISGLGRVVPGPGTAAPGIPGAVDGKTGGPAAGVGRR